MSAFEDVLAALGITATNLLTAVDPTATPTNTPADATTAGAAILAKISGGYTLQVFTSSNASWAVPAGLAGAVEAYAGAIGGGGKGQTGTNANNSLFGFGGSSGGFLSKQFDPSTLGATVAVVVGAAASTIGADGGTSSFGSVVTSSPNGNGISSAAGWTFSTSFPGKGGDGGFVTSGSVPTAGQNGGASAQAAGGTGGAASTSAPSGTGNPGGAGGTGVTGALPICGGGGGGGGGARFSSGGAFNSGTGGAGGNGGFPGGGSGAGGCGVGSGGGSNTGGAPGTPANGLVFVLWK